MIRQLLLGELMAGSSQDSILVIVAHPDDECLGAGGTIRRHVDQGIGVDVLALTGNDTRNKELRAACRLLGVREVYTSIRDDFAIDWSLGKETVQVILKSRPSAVITHSADDYNRNHVQCAQMVADAIEWASHSTTFENAHRVRRIYGMEINSLHSHPHVLMDVSESFATAVSALKEHKSQLTKADAFYLRFYDARTRLRGIQADCERAEAFTISLPTHAGPFYTVNAVKTLI